MTDLEKDKILLLAHSVGKMARELQSIKRLLKEIADTPQTEQMKTADYCDICKQDMCEFCIADASNPYCVPSHYEIKQTETQIETQNSNLTFEKDECAKEYEELGLKELKELINADRKTENSSEKPNNCDEPQTNKDFKVTYTCSFTDCDNFKNFGFGEKCIECKRKQSEAKHKDEPQTDCAWKKPEEFNCKECRWWSPITKTCHCDEFPCKYEPIPII